MTTIAAPIHDGHARPGLLDCERMIARPGINRWLVPPAALAIHLCIGMAYGFTVFWLPLSPAIGATNPVACEGMGLMTALFTTSCDWRVADLGWIYTLFVVLLGLVANALVWPVNPEWHMSEAEQDAIRASGRQPRDGLASGAFGIDRGRFDRPAALVWAAVGFPLLWGIWITLQKTAALF